MSDPIRVIIVDDEWLVRAALRVFLESADGFELVGEAENGADAVALVPLEPDADGYLVGAEEDGVWLNCAVLRLPADSPGLAILNRACATPDEVPAWMPADRRGAGRDVDEVAARGVAAVRIRGHDRFGQNAPPIRRPARLDDAPARLRFLSFFPEIRGRLSPFRPLAEKD